MQSRLQEIRVELEKVIEKQQQWEIADKQIQSARSENQTLTAQREALIVQLAKEEKDVEKLEKVTFTNLFHTIIKDKEERITKEEAQALKVKAELDQVNYNIEENTKRIEVLSQSAGSISVWRNQFDQLILEKKSIIEVAFPEKWKKIREQDEMEVNIKKQMKEINEAVHAGNRLLSEMSGVESSLKSAANWGTYDMLGGGFMATTIKRDHMEHAKAKLEKTQYSIARFKQELVDVNLTIQADLNIGNFMSFADWFFDGFFVDMAVQDKIKEAQRKVNNLKSKINLILIELNQELNELNTKIKDVTTASTEMVLHIN